MDYDVLKASDGTGQAVLAHITANRLPGSSTIAVDSVAKWPAKFIATTGTVGSNNFLVPSSVREFMGHLDSGNIIIDSWMPGFANDGNTVGQVVIIKQTTSWADLIAAALKAHENAKNLPGMVQSYAGRTAPSTEWLMCYGQAVGRTAYAALFNVLVPDMGAVTISIAAPGVITLNAHGLATGSPIYLTTTGALPAGLSANTIYYAIVTGVNTFTLATTYANAKAGTGITTTGSQSGVHNMRLCPYGNGDGTTTFNVPDLRGRAIVGWDRMGGTSADRLTDQTAAAGGTGIDGDILGFVGGNEAHTLDWRQVPNSTGSFSMHGGENSTGFAGWGGLVRVAEVYGGGYKAPPGTSGGANSARYGLQFDLGFGGGAHNNLQPSAVLNYIIKT
jgi:microcystin-dependent protein